MEFRDTKAIYLQIADLLSSQVMDGELAEASRIPSVRDLASSLTVNPATVLRAYEYLCSKDVIQVQRGIGYIVSSGAAQRIEEIRREEFFRTELPLFKEKMRALRIEWDDILTTK